MGKVTLYGTDRFVSGQTPTAEEWNRRTQDLHQAEFEKRDSLSYGHFAVPTLTLNAQSKRIDGTVDCLVYGVRVQGGISWPFSSSVTSGTYHLLIDNTGAAVLNTTVVDNTLDFGTVQWNGTALSTLTAASITVGLHHVGEGEGGGGAVSSVNGKTGAVNLTTTDIPEGTRQYYTDARADARIEAKKGQANGIAGLGADGKVPSSQLPSTTPGSGDLMAPSTASSGNVLAVGADKNHAVDSGIPAAQVQAAVNARHGHTN
jgi:hypothetical protein